MIKKYLDKIKVLIKAASLIKNLDEWLLASSGLLNKTQIIYKINDGNRIVTRHPSSDRSILNDIYLNGVYSPKGFMLKDINTVVDVGAHIGVFSLYISGKFPKSRVYAFEPEPGNYELLKRNVLINKNRNIITANCAISDRTKKCKLYAHKEKNNSDGFSFYKEGRSKKYRIVQAITLEKVMRSNNIRKIDLLKIDCEGEEYPILMNFKGKFKNIKNIFMEYHAANTAHSAEELKEFLEKQGFLVKVMHDETQMLYARNINSS